MNATDRNQFSLTRVALSTSGRAKSKFLSVLAASLQFCAWAGEAPDTQDLIAFFRNAIASPPDIEHFFACKTVLRQQELPGRPEKIKGGSPNSPLMYYEGRRSGSNFTLRSTAKRSDDSPVHETVSGRFGSSTFQRNENTFTRTSEPSRENPENPIARYGDASYVMCSQILNMGLGDLKSESVVWQGDEFKALRDSGTPVYGRLETSNGLPCALRISRSKDESPYKICTYAYPNPPGTLGGFPSKETIWVLFEDGLHPCLEMALLDVRLAERPLLKEDFSEAQFMKASIRYTNIYSGTSLFSVAKDEKLIKVGAPVAKGTYSTSRPPARLALVRILLALAMVASALILWKVCKLNKASTNAGQ